LVIIISDIPEMALLIASAKARYYSFFFYRNFVRGGW